MRPEERPIQWHNAEVISRFQSLWDSGISTQRIADELGITKHSVIGKAHRMHALHPEMFAPRPSPIKHLPDWQTRDKKIRRAPTHTLPKLAHSQPIKTTTAAIKASPGKIEPCNYPTETNSWPRYKACGIPSIPGKPYCAHHCLSCFVALNSEEGKRIRAGWRRVANVIRCAELRATA